MDECDYCELWKKWIESWIHILLFAHNCYPKTAFGRQRHWGFMVPVNNTDEVRTYVRDISSSLQKHFCNGALRAICVAINPGIPGQELRYSLSFHVKGCGPMIAESETHRVWSKLMMHIATPPMQSKWKVFAEMEDGGPLWNSDNTARDGIQKTSLCTLRRTNGASIDVTVEER